MIIAYQVHFKDTRINRIAYGNFFLFIVLVYKCKLDLFWSDNNTTLEVIDVKVF